jgi:hypothetical protein
LPPATPFGPDFLNRGWPLLLEACSFLHDSTRFRDLAAKVKKPKPEALLNLAEAHGVLAQLAAVFDSDVVVSFPPEIHEFLRARRRVQMVSALSLTAELFRFLELLNRAGVEAVTVKGPVLALRAYGDSSIRAYGDVDLVIRHADIGRAAKAAISAGYDSRVSMEAIRRQKVPGQYVFARPGTGALVELHTERTLRYFPRPLPVEKFLQRKASLVLDGHAVPALAVEDEFVVISIHGAKHFWERLMWTSDIAAMVCNCAELDWEQVRECAAEVGAERMVNVALLLAERLLQTPVPEAMKKSVTEDLRCARLVRDIESWLPYGGYAPPEILQRAKFRYQMRGELFAGAAYLSRLSFSTTEEDWTENSEALGSRASEIIRRPFRLAKKHRRDPNS